MMVRTTHSFIATAFSLGLVFGASEQATAQMPDAAAAGNQEITIELESAGAAAASGEAVLEGAGEQTQVVIDVAGAPAEASLQGFLVSGRCGVSEEVIAELGA